MELLLPIIYRYGATRYLFIRQNYKPRLGSISYKKYEKYVGTKRFMSFFNWNNNSFRSKEKNEFHVFQSAQCCNRVTTAHHESGGLQLQRKVRKIFTHSNMNDDASSWHLTRKLIERWVQANFTTWEGKYLMWC